ncbi:MAG: FAD-dependent oxidoreductase [Actinomycetes bacterium]
MKPRVLVLGAGFGGLELSTTLSERFGDAVEVTLIDRNESFSFGYSKLDVMFGRKEPEDVRLYYRDFVKPGVRFIRDTITEIDPEARRVTTTEHSISADYLVIALGADYDYAATPGLLEGGYEFYSGRGATRLASVLPGFSSGHALIGVCDAPFKCPPAPSEAALLLNDALVARGVRDACSISLAMPFSIPVPPSPATSDGLLAAFAERGIEFLPNRRVSALDPSRRIAIFADGSELAYDLFLGVPKHQAPDVVLASGLAVDGYIPVDSATLATSFPGVYAVGDVATVGVPKAGVFSEAAARVVAASLIAQIDGSEPPAPFDGRGSCYIEFGSGRVGRVDVDFLSGSKPTGEFNEPSAALVAEKAHVGSSRRARWFGLNS